MPAKKSRAKRNPEKQTVAEMLAKSEAEGKRANAMPDAAKRLLASIPDPGLVLQSLESVEEQIGVPQRTDLQTPYFAKIYRTARREAVWLREVHPNLPHVPDRTDDYEAGLEGLRRWCIEAVLVTDPDAMGNAGTGKAEHSELPKPQRRGATLKQAAEILYAGHDPDTVALALTTWRRKRVLKPRSIGKSKADGRAKLYDCAALAGYVGKVAEHMAMTESVLCERLEYLAEKPAN